MNNEMDMFSTEKLQYLFGVIMETDAEGRRWWNLCLLTRLKNYHLIPVAIPYPYSNSMGRV